MGIYVGWQRVEHFLGDFWGIGRSNLDALSNQMGSGTKMMGRPKKFCRPRVENKFETSWEECFGLFVEERERRQFSNFGTKSSVEGLMQKMRENEN